MSEREQHLKDELTKMKLQQQQQQQQQMMTEDNRPREESKSSSEKQLDLEDQEESKRQDHMADKEAATGRMQEELKSVKEKEWRLMNQLSDVLQETAKKTDQKQKELSTEIQQKMTDFVQQKPTSEQEVFHQKWQMINDLDTFSSQPDVESMTRKEFKQKVVEMVKEKWVPRNKEYVQNGLDNMRREMATLHDVSLRGLIDEISDTVRDNMKVSLELVDQLKNAAEEEIKLRGEGKAAVNR